MRTKFLLFFALLFTMSGLFMSCSSSGEDPITDSGNTGSGNTGGSNTEIKSDYTATTKVKTVKLTTWRDSPKDVVIYQDFNRRYELAYSLGCFYLLPYTRVNGSWYNCFEKDSWNWLYSEISSLGRDYIIINDEGKVSGLSDITNYATTQNGNKYPEIQPSHGYAMSFYTEDNEVKHLRAYCSKVNLFNGGDIESIVIQYQLY